MIDNSPVDSLKELATLNSRIIYIFNGANLGFGAGHNVAIEKIALHSKYHLILNPDVYFDPSVIEKLYHFIEQYPEIGILSPKVLYPDGSLQYLCRKLPTPLDILLKRIPLPILRFFFSKRMNAYEYRNRDYNEIMNVPSLSGCFMFVRTAVFKKVGGFDEKFFMYMEDFDFSRRFLRCYKTVYYPFVSIYHHYTRESATNKKLLFIAIKSTIYYFNKWGWLVDKERREMNREAQRPSNISIK